MRGSKILAGLIGVMILILDKGISYASVDTVTVPEPSTLILLGSGLVGFIVLRKKIKK